MTTVVYEGHAYQLREGESVLDALIRGGASVAFSCRKGSCHTCLLRAVEGDPGERARRGLPQELVEHDHFKPCVSHPEADLALAPADRAVMTIEAMVAAREQVAPDVIKLSLELMVMRPWTPGQTVELVREDGLSRHYSISSVADEDYFMELHVKLVPDGQMSAWVAESLAEGDMVSVRGPAGSCVYDAEACAGRPLVLVGVGTGIAPLVGVVRDALRAGHEAPIRLVYGARHLHNLYLKPTIDALVAAHPNLQAIACASGEVAELPEGVLAGRTTPHALTPLPEPWRIEDAEVFLCGHPELVNAMRCEAILAGIRRAQIQADPFEWAHDRWPQDRERMEATPADPELWAALGEGPGLRAILETFYAETYEDPRLSPYFHNVTMERAISKQFEFLRDIFSGSRDFFGLKPFNAHHWMIISDELFDYREALFERHLRQHGLAEPLIRRWLAFQEQFRPEIVKSTPRGLIVDGKERLLEGYSLEVLDMAMVCDGCGAEMPEGARGRLHRRTGQLFCMGCGGEVMDPVG